MTIHTLTKSFPTTKSNGGRAKSRSPYDDVIQYCIVKVKELQEITNLKHFRFFVDIDDLLGDDEDEIMNIEIKDNYSEAIINIKARGLELFHDNKEEFFYSLAHEVSHVFTSSLLHLADQRYITEKELERESERTTELITKLIIKIYEGQQSKQQSKSRGKGSA